MVHSMGSSSSSSSSSMSSEGDFLIARTPLLSPASQAPWAIRTAKQPPSWLYPIFVLIVAIAFMALGAFILLFVENHQQEKPSRCTECTDVLVETLWINSQQMAEKEWKRRTRKQLNRWVSTQSDQIGGAPHPKKVDIDGEWSFTDSLYCIFSSVTSIGWGNVAPESQAGRGFLIAYIWLGIPLTLVLIGQLGSIIRSILFFVWKKITLINDALCSLRTNCTGSGCLTYPGRPCCAQCSQRSKPTKGGVITKSDDELPVIILLIFMAVYFVIGGLLIQITERSWTLLDAVYYSHVSFSTIGFGDLVLDENSSLVFFYVYMVIGLVLLALCFQIVQDSLDEILNKVVNGLYRIFCPAYVFITPPISDTFDGRGHSSRRDKRASAQGCRRQRGLIINSV